MAQAEITPGSHRAMQDLQRLISNKLFHQSTSKNYSRIHLPGLQAIYFWQNTRQTLLVVTVDKEGLCSLKASAWSRLLEMSENKGFVSPLSLERPYSPSLLRNTFIRERRSLTPSVKILWTRCIEWSFFLFCNVTTHIFSVFYCNLILCDRLMNEKHL